MRQADIKVCVFTTCLSQLNSYLPSLPLDIVGQDVVALNKYELKDVLYIAIMPA